MGGRAGGGAGAGRGGSVNFSKAGGMKGGLSDSDRADLAMYKKTGSDAAEMQEHIARKIASNKQGAASVSNVTLTKGSNGRFTLSWTDNKGRPSSIGFGPETTAAQAKAAANVLKQTGHSGKAMYQTK